MQVHMKEKGSCHELQNFSVGYHQTCRPIHKKRVCSELARYLSASVVVFSSNEEITVLRYRAEIDCVVERNCSQVKLSGNWRLGGVPGGEVGSEVERL